LSFIEKPIVHPSKNSWKLAFEIYKEHEKWHMLADAYRDYANFLTRYLLRQSDMAVLEEAFTVFARFFTTGRTAPGK